MHPDELDRLWNYGQPALSERRFRDLLAETGPTATVRLEALT
jgi:hypothetical protein